MFCVVVMGLLIFVAEDSSAQGKPNATKSDALVSSKEVRKPGRQTKRKKKTQAMLPFLEQENLLLKAKARKVSTNRRARGKMRRTGKD